MLPLKFGGASDLVNCGRASSLNDFDPCSFAMWIMPTALTAVHRVVGKGLDGTGVRQIQFTTTQIQTTLDRATTNNTSTANLSAFAAWQGVGFRYFLACSNKASGGASGDQLLWLGSLTVPASEPSAYASQVVGTGSVVSDSGVDLTIGNRHTGSLQFTGLIWVLGMFNVQFTTTDVRALQAQMLNPRFLPPNNLKCGGYWVVGGNGTGGVRDETGNGNHGTITGAIPTGDWLPRRTAA